MAEYCGARSAEGWYCVLAKGHDGPHLSIDNSKLWKGSPGAPVRWTRRPAVAVLSAEGQRGQNAKTRGFTGIPCDHCGSPNTIRNGKCLLCTDCQASGECG